MRHLTRAEIEAFCDSKEHWIILTTLDADGFPHSVPMGYFRVGEQLVMGCRPDTRKVRNIERDPRVSLLLESGRQGRPLVGVMFQGRAEVVRDDSERLSLKQEAARQRGEQPPDSVGPHFVYIRVTPERTISWER